MEVIVFIIVVAVLIAVLSQFGEQEKEQCCGTTVPKECNCGTCLLPLVVSVGPWTISFPSVLWSAFLYSVGVLHVAFSLVGIKDFYQKSVKFYQDKISSRTDPRCNLTPTCSEYSIKAVDKNGIWEGVSLTVDRLQQCAEASTKTKEERKTYNPSHSQTR